MEYHWTDCPGCGCQLAINYTATGGRISGSVRRWSTDRSVNDGRPFEIGPGIASPDGSFTTVCICGQEIRVTSHATGGEREDGLRVQLSSE